MLGLLLPTHPVKRFAILCCRGRKSYFVFNLTIFHSVPLITIFGSPFGDCLSCTHDPMRSKKTLRSSSSIS